jgi:hypothetical protein
MTLHQLLQLIQQRHIILRPGSRGRVAFWAPNVRVPRQARQAIKAHTSALRELLASNDVHVCPAQDLHRSSWKYAGQGCYICGECQRLQPYLSAQRKEEKKAS